MWLARELGVGSRDLGSGEQGMLSEKWNFFFTKNSEIRRF